MPHRWKSSSRHTKGCDSLYQKKMSKGRYDETFAGEDGKSYDTAQMSYPLDARGRVNIICCKFKKKNMQQTIIPSIIGYIKLNYIEFSAISKASAVAQWWSA